MSEWTPGPWEAAFVMQFNANAHWSVWTVDEQWLITDIPGSADSPERTEANARLISAAPEMAELLRWVADNGEGMGSSIEFEGLRLPIGNGPEEWMAKVRALLSTLEPPPKKEED